MARFAAQGSFFLRRFQLIQRIHGGIDNIQQVAAAQRFGQDIRNPGCFQHSTHTTAGDNAGTGRGRLEQARERRQTCPITSCGMVVPIHGDFVHILAGMLGSFAHGIRHSICLTDAHANTAAIIANNHSHPEGETATTFDHFCNASDINNTLVKFWCSNS